MRDLGFMTPQQRNIGGGAFDAMYRKDIRFQKSDVAQKSSVSLAIGAPGMVNFEGRFRHVDRDRHAKFVGQLTRFSEASLVKRPDHAGSKANLDTPAGAVLILDERPRICQRGLRRPRPPPWDPVIET